MNAEYNFKQGQNVGFSNSGISGTGIIKGVAGAPTAVIGATYIIEVLTAHPPIDPDVYPFDHIAVFEAHITPMTNEQPMQYTKHAMTRLQERFSHHLVPNQHILITINHLFNKAVETKRFFNNTKYMVYVMERYGDLNIKYFEYEDIVFVVRNDIIMTVFDSNSRINKSSRFQRK